VPRIVGRDFEREVEVPTLYWDCSNSSAAARSKPCWRGRCRCCGTRWPGNWGSRLGYRSEQRPVEELLVDAEVHRLPEVWVVERRLVVVHVQERPREWRPRLGVDVVVAVAGDVVDVVQRNVVYYVEIALLNPGEATVRVGDCPLFDGIEVGTVLPQYGR